MKVLYFHQHFGTPQGSTGTRSYEFSRALARAGHQVTVICGYYTGAGLDLQFDRLGNCHRGWLDGVEIVAFAIPYSNRDNLVRRAAAFLRYALRSLAYRTSHDCDLVFATSTPLTAGIPGIVGKFLRLEGAFVFEVRDLWPELPRALGMRNPLALGAMSALEWVSYWTADAAVGLAPGIVAGILRRAPGKRVVMIPNGCDLDLFRPSAGAQGSIAGVSKGDFVAVFMGTHGPANGLDSVLDLAEELMARGRNDIKILLVGDGRDKPRLLADAQRRRLGNCVFLDPVRKLHLSSLVNRCGCGLMVLADVPAFYHGTSPNKFFDYISSGLPVVNNYPGWLAGLIREYDCGIAVPPRDRNAFADALCRLADAPNLCAAMGRNGRRLAEVQFSRDSLAREWVEFITSVESAGTARDDLRSAV